MDYKARHFLSEMFKFGDVTNKVFPVLCDASRYDFEKSCSTNFV
jgi:hypothetical protein